MAKFDFSFVEVGVSYGDLEFFQSFMYPTNLLMRKYINGSVIKVSVADWLQSDFVTALGLRLHLLDMSKLRLVSVSSFRPQRADMSPVVYSNSLPDSWVSPFIHLIAETFLNTYYHGCKI